MYKKQQRTSLHASCEGSILGPVLLLHGVGLEVLEKALAIERPSAGLFGLLPAAEIWWYMGIVGVHLIAELFQLLLGQLVQEVFYRNIGILAQVLAIEERIALRALSLIDGILVYHSGGFGYLSLRVVGVGLIKVIAVVAFNEAERENEKEEKKKQGVNGR